ncbi:MAG: hypothetical protein KDJ90_06595 [Nitratireductor sp.]|nr:hypothetical protein [Nitratireductor sp.]
MAYNFIERLYGTRFKPGMRVRFTEYDDAPGIVKRVTGDPQYVRVKFDDGREGDCHPDSLKIKPACGPAGKKQEAWPAAGRPGKHQEARKAEGLTGKAK